MYHSLTAARALPAPFLSGFIHVPAGLPGKGCHPGGASADAKCALTWGAAVAGSVEIIAACLESAALL
jgi:hypothetical protein